MHLPSIKMYLSCIKVYSTLIATVTNFSCDFQLQFVFKNSQNGFKICRRTPSTNSNKSKQH